MKSDSDSEAISHASPRKRRKLASSDPARPRKHDLLRRSEIEQKYNDKYRVFYNEHVTAAASRFDVDLSVSRIKNLVGSSLWLAKEQALFFAALDRLGRNDIPGIARAIGTKSEAETRAFLLLLQDSSSRRPNAGLRLCDIPAAADVGRECDDQLEYAADALAWYQERFEASQEQERYGSYWLITPHIAAQIEEAVHGVAPSRSVSMTSGNEFNKPNKEVTVACIRCKTDRRKCDHGIPCERCATLSVDCIYPRMDGQGKAGACDYCKKGKRRCDRQIPCASCVRKNIDCTYSSGSQTPSGTLHGIEDLPDIGDDDGDDPEILKVIPEAELLRPELMLHLAKHLFMNRSADDSSPWPHWSEYTSELAAEPSMYRTAFNDFHRLVVSLTKRLVHTTLLQTTSRLRARRVGTSDRNLRLPLVRSRDIYAAIDVLGLERNANNRWKGVARRCGLIVTDKHSSTKAFHQNVVPLDEVERILASDTPMKQWLSKDTPTLDQPENFRSRAVRSGTPLPMQDLNLSDSEDDFRHGRSDDSDADSTEGLEETGTPEDEENANALHDTADLVSVKTTLEQFDQSTSQLEEGRLWDMLGLRPTSRDDHATIEDELGEQSTEKIVSTCDDWQQIADYRASWEILDKPIPVTTFLANRKQPSSMSATNGKGKQSIRHLSGDSSDSSADVSRRPKRKLPAPIELHARGTNAYAAWQGEDLGTPDQDNISSSYSEFESREVEEDGVLEEDIPTQSIEAEPYSSDMEIDDVAY